jgi:hypothetical protein
VGELLLAVVEPPCRLGCIGQQEKAHKSDHASSGTLNNE